MIKVDSMVILPETWTIFMSHIHNGYKESEKNLFSLRFFGKMWSGNLSPDHLHHLIKIKIFRNEQRFDWVQFGKLWKRLVYQCKSALTMLVLSKELCIWTIKTILDPIIHWVNHRVIDQSYWNLLKYRIKIWVG